MDANEKMEQFESVPKRCADPKWGKVLADIYRRMVNGESSRINTPFKEKKDA